MTADGGVLHHLDVILRDLGGRGRCAGRRGGPRTPRRRPRPQAPATGCFGIPEGGIDLSWGDLWGHKSVNERPRPGAHIPDIFRDELEEDGCQDLIIEAKFQALALENPVDVGEFFVFPDCVRRADITCYLRDLWVVDGASDDLVEGRDWTGERICIRRGMKVSKKRQRRDLVVEPV